MKSHQTLALLAALAALSATSFAHAATDAAKAEPKKATATAPAAEDKIVKMTAKQRLPKTVKQLIIIDTDIGDKSAAPVETDNAVLVGYTGWLYDASKPEGKGEKFDSSAGRVAPFGFFIGAGKVIKGWDRGIVGMRPKGKRTLIIPPSLAYGNAERPRIPANSTLIFDIELQDIVGKRETRPVVTTATAPLDLPSLAVAPITIARLSPQDALPTAPTQITVIDQTPSDGQVAASGNEVLVHYTGWLYDPSMPGGKGKQFDTSRERNQLFRFKLGGGRVIKGWDNGVVGMKLKGQRTLIIPADFGYGVRGAGGGLIPPNATLIFDVELVEIPAPVATTPPG